MVLVLVSGVTGLLGCKKNGVPIESQNGIISCDNFPPPPGERWVYGVLMGQQYYAIDTVVTEAVNEVVGGYRVYRVRHRWYPPGLGDYIGCNPQLGKVRVASDWWDVSNPNVHGRTVYPQAAPVTGCVFGSPVGTVITLIDVTDTLTIEVVSYLSVTVPAGSYQNVMRVKFTSREGRRQPDYYFDHFDQAIGSVKQEYPLIPATLELMQYRPSGG